MVENMKTYDSDTVNLTELYDDERIPYSLVIPEYQRSYLERRAISKTY